MTIANGMNTNNQSIQPIIFFSILYFWIVFLKREDTPMFAVQYGKYLAPAVAPEIALSRHNEVNTNQLHPEQLPVQILFIIHTGNST
jgi:hypothetical protein